MDLVDVFLLLDKGDKNEATKILTKLLHEDRLRDVGDNLREMINIYGEKEDSFEKKQEMPKYMTQKNPSNKFQEFLCFMRELFTYYNAKMYLELRAILSTTRVNVNEIAELTERERLWFQAVLSKIKGEIEEIKGNSIQAIKYFEESEQTFKQIEYTPMLNELLVKVCEESLKIDDERKALETYNNLKHENQTNPSKRYDKELELYSHLVLANYFGEKGDIATAQKYYQHYRDGQYQIELNVISFQERVYQGKFSFFMGDYEQALENFKEAYDIALRIKDPTKISMSKYYIAEIYINEGLFEEALSELYDAASYCTFYESQAELAMILQKIAYIYYLKGEINDALEFLNKSVMIQERLKNQKGLAFSFLRYALILLHQQRINDALYYLKMSLTFFKTKDYKLMILETYFIYSLILLGSQKKIDFTEEYHEVVEIAKQVPLQIATAFRVSILANYLKAKKELRSLSKAISLYLLVQKRYKNYFSLFINALIQLLDCLYLELKIFNNKETLKNIHKTINELEEIGTKVTSYYFLALVMYLRGKMFLIELDIDKALSNMINARQIAEEKGLKPLVESINAEIETISQSIHAWQLVLDKNMSVKDRIQFFNVDQIMNQFVKYLSQQSWKLEYEQPIMILIYNEGGVLLYFRKFDDSKAINEGLITAYLTSITQFSKETFKISSNMELIKHGDYTILSVNKDRFIFTYIFTGVNHIAYKKLELFSNEILNNEKLVASLSREISGLATNEKTFINKIADRIFLLTEIIDEKDATDEEKHKKKRHE